MKRYTLSKSYAHTTGNGTVIVPDEVANDQEAYDGKTFPALKLHNCGEPTKCRARLRGELYGLHTSGTGDMVVQIV